MQEQAADVASVTNDPGSQEASNAVPTNVTASPQMALQVVETETGEPLPKTKLYLFNLFEDGRGKVVRSSTTASRRITMLEILPAMSAGWSLTSTKAALVPD
jgi:hypothetical protein